METVVSAALGALAVALAALFRRRAPARPFSRLPLPDDPANPWLVALAGYVLGGVGVALSFRTVPDLAVGVVFLLPLGAASTESGLAWWYWIFAALAGLYCVARAENANRLRR